MPSFRFEDINWDNMRVYSEAETCFAYVSGQSVREYFYGIAPVSKEAYGRKIKGPIEDA